MSEITPTKRVLDEETRKQLFGVYPFNADQTIPFTPDELKNVKEEFRVIFTIRALKQDEKRQLDINIGSIKEESTNEQVMDMVTKNNDIFRACVLGWVNLFSTGTCEEILFKPDVDKGADKEIWNSFSEAIKKPIFLFIRKISGLLTIDQLGLK
jgi:hypothetical protein